MDELNFCISRFITECRKQDGAEYPTETLYSIVICLQLFFEKLGHQYKFLRDSEFIQIRNTLDNVMKEKARRGSDAPKKQAREITVEEENTMWDLGVLGTDTPQKLLHTLFYSIGLNFALRGGEEHRQLRPSQLLIVKSSDGKRYLEYTESVSKANQGGLKHKRINKKVVRAYENTEKPERCILRIFEMYMDHRPKGAPDALYLRPKKPPTKEWYCRVPTGRHTLCSVVRNICTAAGLTGYRTNHSLRASAATRLFNANVDEQLIKETTGHSSDAVRSYKRTSDDMKRKTNAIVQGQTVTDEGSSIKLRKVNQPINVTVNISL